MMTIIHQWNTKDNQSRQPIFKPISLSATGSEQCSELEKMGIIESENTENNDHTWIQDKDKDINSLGPKLFYYVAYAYYAIARN